MPRDEPAEEVRVDATREIVARRNRAERARVVVEAGGVVDARRLRDLLPKARHALDRIVEPPRRAEPHRRIVTGERRELARVSRLVEREEHAA